MLNTLSEASLHRNFNPYVDIHWKPPEFAVRDDDPRWILPPSDPLGRNPWYLVQPREHQIAIGMWRRSKVAKVGLQFEHILIRGLMHYTFRLPNFSPEYRNCLHEALEECHHSMTFQEYGQPRRRRRSANASLPALPVAVDPADRQVNAERFQSPGRLDFLAIGL